MTENITERDLLKLVKDLEKDLHSTQLSIKHGIDNLVDTETKDIEAEIEQLNEILKENLDYISENLEKMALDENPELDEENIFWQKEQDMFYIEHKLNKEKLIIALPPNADHQMDAVTDYLQEEIQNANKILKLKEKQLNSLKQQSNILNKTLDEQKKLNEYLTDYEMSLTSQTNESMSQLEILKDKYNSLKVLENDRAQKLGQLCEKLFRSPDKSDVVSTKSANDFDTDMKSMADIIEVLLNRYINFRHDPWVAIEETFWVGHVNTLRNISVIKSNPNNANLITLDCDI